MTNINWHLMRTSLMFVLFVSSSAADLTDIFENRDVVALGLGPVGPALANTVASTYPIASASASVTYVYDPILDTFERQTRLAGPIIGERAETLGARRINFAASYSHVMLSTINGEELDDLTNRASVNGRMIIVAVPSRKGVVILRDLRRTNFLPVRVTADLDVRAHIVSPSITYGATPNLDLNVTFPLVRTSLDLTTNTRAPDPRLPQFALCPRHVEGCEENLRPLLRSNSLSDSAEGIGDLLIRAKYTLLRTAPCDVGAGLAVSVPTGESQDFHGTGNAHVQPIIILSRVVARRFQPLLNVGADVNTEDPERSSVRWAAGASVELINPLTSTIVFVGRHELSEQVEKISLPFFFQVERNDILDAAVGVRYRFGDNGILSANALVPLNSDGLRADVIPTVEIGYAF
jgi:hypothetical protein